jgi:quercetin dioxygenase-like cupin family protein
MNYTQHSWGFELIWADKDEYSARTMVIKEGEKTPYIYHKKRNKTLFILQGTVQLNIEGRNKLLMQGDSYDIPPKIMHRIIALKDDATVLEAGTKLVENDIVIVEE